MKFALLCSSILFIALIFGCTTNSPTGAAVTSFVRDDGNITVYFCPLDSCEEHLADFLKTAIGSIHCALYDFNLVHTSSILLNKTGLDVRIVGDDDNKAKFEKLLSGISFVSDHGAGLMHNKFCVVDGKRVMTGSMNPTARDTRVNNNNLLFIESSVIARDYETEFLELWGQKKNAANTPVPHVLLGSIPVSIYFCPEDECADKVIAQINDAQHYIYFMTFSFTNTGIGDALLVARERGVEVRGVFEKTQLNDYTMYPVLLYQGADVRIDGNKGNMHHKVFIIDNSTVITGSFNPTKGGDEKNDENMVVIKDKQIAALFLKEFDYVASLAHYE